MIEVEDHRRRLFAGLARARADDVDIRARAPTRSGRARRRRGIRSTRRRRAPDRPGRRRRRRGRRAPRPGRVDPRWFLDPPVVLRPPVVLSTPRWFSFSSASAALSRRVHSLLFLLQRREHVGFPERLIHSPRAPGGVAGVLGVGVFRVERGARSSGDGGGGAGAGRHFRRGVRGFGVHHARGDAADGDDVAIAGFRAEFGGGEVRSVGSRRAVWRGHVVVRRRGRGFISRSMKPSIQRVSLRMSSRRILDVRGASKGSAASPEGWFVLPKMPVPIVARRVRFAPARLGSGPRTSSIGGERR